jgi:hypothetical protein
VGGLQARLYTQETTAVSYALRGRSMALILRSRWHDGLMMKVSAPSPSRGLSSAGRDRIDGVRLRGAIVPWAGNDKTTSWFGCTHAHPLRTQCDAPFRKVIDSGCLRHSHHDMSRHATV